MLIHYKTLTLKRILFMLLQFRGGFGEELVCFHLTKNQRKTPKTEKP